MNTFKFVNFSLWVLLGFLLSWAGVNVVDQPLQFISITVVVLLIELSFIEAQDGYH